MRYPDLSKQDQTYIPAYTPGEHGIEPLRVPIDKLPEFNRQMNAAVAQIEKIVAEARAKRLEMIETLVLARIGVTGEDVRDLCMVEEIIDGKLTYRFENIKLLSGRHFPDYSPLASRIEAPEPDVPVVK